MSTTITSSSTAQVTYSDTTANPITIAGSVTLSSTLNAQGEFFAEGSGTGTNQWTLVNYGTVSAGDPGHTGGIGIQLGQFFGFDVGASTIANHGAVYGS